MAIIRRKSLSRSAAQSGSMQKTDSNASFAPRKEKEGKGQWFSQIKDWITTSEPSKQALKDYKKEAFRRAGVDPNDPRATAKLHIPATILPPEAIKPSGSGPEPEDLARRRAERKRLPRESFQTTSSSSGASRMGSSHQTSLSSLQLGDYRDDF